MSLAIIVDVWVRQSKSRSSSASTWAARTSRLAWSTTPAERSRITRCAPSRRRAPKTPAGGWAWPCGGSIGEAGVSASDVVRAGLATPGPMDIPNGMILRPGNLPGWWDFPIRDRVSHHLGMPVTFANDANAAAYGEYLARRRGQVSQHGAAHAGHRHRRRDHRRRHAHRRRAQLRQRVRPHPGQPGRRCADGFARQARLAGKLLQRDGGGRSRAGRAAKRRGKLAGQAASGRRRNHAATWWPRRPSKATSWPAA